MTANRTECLSIVCKISTAPPARSEQAKRGALLTLDARTAEHVDAEYLPDEPDPSGVYRTQKRKSPEDTGD